MKCAKSDPKYRKKVSDALTGKKASKQHIKHLRKIAKMKKSPRTREHVSNLVSANYDNGTYMPIGTIRQMGGQGYYFIKAYTDRGRRNWVSLHRWNMEQYIGRPLKKNEHVHHIDGDKSNNNLDNLALLTASEHYTLNHLITKLNNGNPDFSRIVILTMRSRYPELF